MRLLKFIKAYVALKELTKQLEERGVNLEFGIENFEQRLILQKLVYILQEFGVPLNYSFNWYMHGPYSPELTSDAFSYLSILQEHGDNRVLGDLEASDLPREEINEVAKVIEKIKSETGMYGGYLVEAIATLIYIRKYVDRENAVQHVIKLKPKFSKYEEKLEKMNSVLENYI